MRQYEFAIRIAQIHHLLDERKYKKALAVVRTLDMKQVKSVSDLSAIADVFAKTEQYDSAKETYLKIYNKSKTRRIVYRLAYLAIRTKNIDEAEKYYQEYLQMNPGTRDIIILRYRIDKAAGVPVGRLIEILEELKEEEYIEEWAYELARLYHRAGRFEECRRECEDIQLWFGHGEIVEKAKKLIEYVDDKESLPYIDDKDYTLADREPNPDDTGSLPDLKEYLGNETADNGKHLKGRKPEEKQERKERGKDTGENHIAGKATGKKRAGTEQELQKDNEKKKEDFVDDYDEEDFDIDADLGRIAKEGLSRLAGLLHFGNKRGGNNKNKEYKKNGGNKPGSKGADDKKASYMDNTDGSGIVNYRDEKLDINISVNEELYKKTISGKRNSGEELAGKEPPENLPDNISSQAAVKDIPDGNIKEAEGIPESPGGINIPNAGSSENNVNTTAGGINVDGMDVVRINAGKINAIKINDSNINNNSINANNINTGSAGNINNVNTDNANAVPRYSQSGLGITQDLSREISAIYEAEHKEQLKEKEVKVIASRRPLKRDATKVIERMTKAVQTDEDKNVQQPADVGLHQGAVRNTGKNEIKTENSVLPGGQEDYKIREGVKQKAGEEKRSAGEKPEIQEKQEGQGLEEETGEAHAEAEKNKAHAEAAISEVKGDVFTEDKESPVKETYSEDKSVAASSEETEDRKETSGISVEDNIINNNTGKDQTENSINEEIQRVYGEDPGKAEESKTEGETAPEEIVPEEIVMEEEQEETAGNQAAEDEVEDSSLDGITGGGLADSDLPTTRALHSSFEDILTLIGGEPDPSHFVFVGNSSELIVGLSKRIVKVMKNTGYMSIGKIAKISAKQLNLMNLDEFKNQLKGNCLLVDEAAELMVPTIASIFDIMDEFYGDFVVILADDGNTLDQLFRYAPALARRFKYIIDISGYTEDDCG